MTYIWQTGAWPNFTYDVQAVELPLAAAMRAMGKVEGLKLGLNASDLDMMNRRQLVQEALSSFEIEGVRLNADEVEASVIASLTHRDSAAVSRRSDAIVELMLTAREARFSLDPQALCHWHRLLFHGIEVEDLGRWRSFDIEIVRSAIAGRNEVIYKGVPPARLDDEMVRFLGWLQEKPIKALPVRAAIAHLWFESIHPFSDGNGRIGRALIEYIFATEHPLPFSLSRQIERDKSGYYKALQDGRTAVDGKIDATPFVIWMLDALVAAADTARVEAMFVIRRNTFFAKHAEILNERQSKALRVLFDKGEDRVAMGLSAKTYRKISKTSAATASRDLSAMERAGVLTRSDAGGRSTSYDVIY